MQIISTLAIALALIPLAFTAPHHVEETGAVTAEVSFLFVFLLPWY
jgi:hypothetical protein